ncbi:5-formyltetrahydrofolate cyclo-ligase [Rubellimicrobium thermophilum DSM 16684]|uniref:5-formyltetrahydrofolate cyclo-ligase n=1 Tax=Rubellimicrobium thermophilum DSM 16684 TaxID=1123069 RepID=S9R7F1_9RHOB|nr:5-formyltetrahydrofolate cyclo-ligase [Rubellimicrobium thermophilum]EPX87827.1 5-formyltetrahydrofolate cyclo-ligase [Rubellimicrobium thermophilum DSM 16684]
MAERQALGAALAGHLRRLVADRFGPVSGRVLSGYWPIRGEFDLRGLMADWHREGAILALPVVERKAAPLVGWAMNGEGGAWRLGYGGGYFDRTLAVLTPRPFAIGVGLAAARLSTIFPQPHDIPLAAIVTEAGRAEKGPAAAGLAEPSAAAAGP